MQEPSGLLEPMFVEAARDHGDPSSFVLVEFLKCLAANRGEHDRGHRPGAAAVCGRLKAAKVMTMKSEYGFSSAERGKFFRKDVTSMCRCISKPGCATIVRQTGNQIGGGRGIRIRRAVDMTEHS
jgi:hypothetical protein